MADRLTDTEVEVLDELSDYEPGMRKERLQAFGLGTYLRGLEDDIDAASGGGGGGGASLPTIVVTDAANYTVLDGDDYILSTRSATGTQSIVLPPIADHETKVLFIVDRARNASQNAITVSPDGAETINGQAAFIITQDGDSITLVGAGTEWTIV